MFYVLKKINEKGNKIAAHFFTHVGQPTSIPHGNGGTRPTSRIRGLTHIYTT